MVYIDEYYKLSASPKADRGWHLAKQGNSRWKIRIFDAQNTSKMRNKLLYSEEEPIVMNDDVNKVYNNIRFILGYFYDKLGLNSIDNFGMCVDVNIHYKLRYNNASWDGEQLSFGDGDGINFNGFAMSLSVLTSELFKGVIQYSAGLIYKGQSGAINESFSDAIASAVKQCYRNESAENADWLIGDEVTIGKFKDKGIRSMKSPSDLSVVIMAQPDHMLKIYKGISDNGGVHINSGILNKAFYLVSIDIGTQEAALLWFKALKFLKPTAKFRDLYKALTIVAAELILENKVPATTKVSLDKAFMSVGIINKS